MSKSVAVAGASGYSGGELLRLLAAHPDLVVVAAAAGGKAGQAVVDVHPQLRGAIDTATGMPPYDGLNFAETSAASLAADVVFLALPHGQSAALAKQLPERTLVIDLGADFRLRDAADWQTYYGGEHAGSWIYGMPELPGKREEIAASARIANPGCYPTSIILALAPLLAAGLVQPEDIVVVAASGTSGAGRKASEALLGSEVMSSMSAYKAGGLHQHTPEIAQALSEAAGTAVSLLFTPTLAPMPRGILATSTARAQPGVTAADLHNGLQEAYADETFVCVLPLGTWPRTASVLGSNSVHLAVGYDHKTGRATVVSAIDNLLKGAAGQALQNANIALGLPETTGLPIIGVAP